VDAAAKALELLSTFSFHERHLSLSTLAARTGIPRATAFRLLSTLEAAGFVTKVSGEYQLGLKCFMLGNVVAADLNLREIARRISSPCAMPCARRRRSPSSITGRWSIWSACRRRSPVGFMRARTGAILPAYCTALGKTLLAYEPHGNASAATDWTNRNARSGVRCIAAPVRNHEGRIVAAISVAGPAERLPRTLVGSAVATAVVAAAQAISLDLGAGSIPGHDAALPAHGGLR
jgi:DNA-binding IclR family transcriptional regulator